VKPKVFHFFVLPLLFFSTGSPAYADSVLFSRTLVRGAGYCCAPAPTAVQLMFGVYDFAIATLNPVVFDGRLFTTADVGVTFRADAASDADFPQLVAALANGVNDYVGDAVLSPEGLGSIGARPESEFFAGLLPVRLGPDLLGYHITAMTLRIDALELLPATDNQGGGTLDARVTYSFEGTPPPIPEPATLLLVGAGLVGVARRMRRAAS
jgi:hypothetical protein